MNDKGVGLPSLDSLGRDLVAVRAWRITQHDRGLLSATIGNGPQLLVLAAVLLVGCGGFAIFQAASGNFLPHDTTYLGLSAHELCAFQDCRILHFMIHDRISFGGVVVANGVLYLWLALFPMRRRESWAWWALATSSAVGFASFLSYLGYGYLDTWHGVVTLTLLPLFVVGLTRSARLRRNGVSPEPLDLRTRPGIGRALLLLSSVGISIAGLTIMTVGMTRIFVPQDLEFIGMGHAAVGAINPHLLPLIAHDRAGFGGALLSFGVAMFGCLRYAPPSRALHQALTTAGVAGFGAAVGVHPAIGYLSVTHLAPAVLGCLVYAAGLVLLRSSSGVPEWLGSRISPSVIRRDVPGRPELNRTFSPLVSSIDTKPRGCRPRDAFGQTLHESSRPDIARPRALFTESRRARPQR